MTPFAKRLWFAPSWLAGLGVLGLLGTGMTGVAAPLAVAATPAGGLPLYFEAGQGRAGAPAEFIARGVNSQFLISATGAQIALRKTGAGPAALQMRFVGANPRAQVRGGDELAGKINYLTGNNPAQWRTGIPTFARVRVRDLYPGIGLVYYGNQRRLEYDFNVAPGANLNDLKLRFAGADRIAVNREGELVLTLPGGKIRQLKPLVYQMVHGVREVIDGGYRMADANTVAFSIGKYDPRLPLVIDPILSYSTYFGGNGNDAAWAVAVDTNGFVYVAGQTTSTQFAPDKPWATAGAFQTNFQGGATSGDAFVAKFDNLGTNLVYLTYLGGNADDVADAIAVDSSGNACVAGWTDSPNFPTTTNAPDRTIGGTPTPPIGYPIDAFVAKLNAGGSNLIFSTYLGGAASDDATAVALDSSNNVYVTGFTYSTNFPTTENAYQKKLGVTNWVYQAYYNANAFVTEIAACGTNLLYSSYLGGTNYDISEGIALGGSGSVYMAGFTASANFPTTNSISQFAGTNYLNGHLLNGSTNATGAYDAFVAKFAPGFSNLVYSTFLGGANNDQAYHLAVDPLGNAYVTGWTVSTNFPDSATGVPGLYNGLTNNAVYGYPVVTNAFLAKVTWNGTNAGIGYSAVFGGTNYGVDIGYGVAVDQSGNAFVVGATSTANFPAANAPVFLNATNAGESDAFVTAFNTNASALLYSTCLGGANNDYGYGIAVDSQDNAYIVGQTFSSNFLTNNARQAALNGSSDAFLAKIISVVEPPQITTQPTNQSASVGTTLNVAVSVTGTPPFTFQWQLQATNLTWTNLVNGGNISGATNTVLTISDAQTNNSGSYQVIVTNYAGSVTSAVAVLTVTNVLPVITNQPESQTVGVGSDASFGVGGINGTIPEYAQWFKDGTVLTNGPTGNGSTNYGATSANLYIVNVQTNDAGIYWLAITNPAGVVTSSNAVLTVVTFPTILMPPTNQVAGLGADVNFSVNAAGSVPLSYRWLMDGTNAVGGPVSGANTNDTLTLTNTQIGDNGRSFSVIVTNLVGAVTSSPPAVLTVLTAPRFTRVINEGGTNFNISVAGGTNSGSFALLTSTNLALPFTNWTSLGTNNFDSQGGFNFGYSLTNPLPHEFFILQMQSP